MGEDDFELLILCLNFPSDGTLTLDTIPIAPHWGILHLELYHLPLPLKDIIQTLKGFWELYDSTRLTSIF